MRSAGKEAVVSGWLKGMGDDGDGELQHLWRKPTPSAGGGTGGGMDGVGGDHRF